MGTHRGRDVIFDWNGSLALARHAWITADELDMVIRERHRLASNASRHWSGPTAVEFGCRIENEVHTAAAVANELRHEAQQWAVEWKQAMDQENFNRYQDACDRARDGSSLWDAVKDSVFGEDDLPSQPALATTPRAPEFAPTRSVINYR